MNIYKNYSVDDILFDLPCNINNQIQLYPVRLLDYKRFNELSKYIKLGKDTLELKSDMDVLRAVIQVALYELSNGEEEKLESAFQTIINEMEELFSILTRDEITFKYGVSEKIMFTSKDNKNTISEYNFSILREVAMKQNLIHEPKIYKNKIVSEWAERVKKARAKNRPPIEIYDIINIIRVGLNIPYKEIREMNIFQLFADFTRLAHNENYRATILFKTVSSEIPNVDYTEGVINQLFKNPDDDLFKDSGASKLGDMYK